jgi:hypothetical protein
MNSKRNSTNSEMNPRKLCKKKKEINEIKKTGQDMEE